MQSFPLKIRGRGRTGHSSAGYEPVRICISCLQKLQTSSVSEGCQLCPSLVEFPDHWQEAVKPPDVIVMYRKMFTFHLYFIYFFFLPPLWDFNGLCSRHLCVAVLSTPVVPKSLAAPTHDCLFESTGDAMKGHVHRSSQHLASALACFFSLLLVPQRPRKVCLSPPSCVRAAGSRATHCPGFTAWRSALEYTLSSLCPPNYIRRKNLDCMRVAMRPRYSEVYLYFFYLEVRFSWQELLAGVCPRPPGSLVRSQRTQDRRNL